MNDRAGWVGHLFQNRFASVAMDENHLINAVFYVSLNPVRARLCQDAADWPWSSARAHQTGRDSEHVRVAPVLERIPDFAERLGRASESAEAKAAFDRLRAAERSGRPVGSRAFIADLEEKLGRRL